MGQTLTNGIYLPAEGERNCYEGLAANWTALDGLVGGYNVHISNTTIHVTAADKEAWNGKADASALTAHTGDTTIHVTAEDKAKWDAVTSKADASALTAHTGDTTIHVTSADKQAWDGHVADSVKHVTAEDKAAWNGKADASALTAHTGDTTIHVTAEDKQAWNGKADASALTAHTGNTTIHVTAEDKAKWDAVTGKADASALTAHTGDTTIHVTAEDKQAWNGKANDADVVHKSGDETVSGKKTFSDIVPINGAYLGNEPSTSFRSVLLLRSRYDTAGKSGWLVSKFRSNSAQGALSGSDTVFLNFDVLENEVRTNGILRFNLSSWSGNAPGRFSLIPNSAIESYLGTQGNKWAAINGLEPSSLSLPSDISARIDISSYFTNTGTGQSNSYTVPANGYIYLTLSELTNVHCFSRSSGNVTNYAQTFTKLSNSTGVLYILFPVRKNDVFATTWYTTTTVSVDGAFFIPCRGNV